MRLDRSPLGKFAAGRLCDRFALRRKANGDFRSHAFLAVDENLPPVGRHDRLTDTQAETRAGGPGNSLP